MPLSGRQLWIVNAGRMLAREFIDDRCTTCAGWIIVPAGMELVCHLQSARGTRMRQILDLAEIMP